MRNVVNFHKLRDVTHMSTIVALIIIKSEFSRKLVYISSLSRIPKDTIKSAPYSFQYER